MEDYYTRYDDWVDECKKLTKEDWKPPEPLGKDDIRRERSQFRRVSTNFGGIGRGPTRVDPYVAADGPAQYRQPLQERSDPA